MPRLGRIVIAGVPHHIRQCGNNRQDVFLADDDQRVYLDLLKEQADRFGVQVMGYCLMANHVHLVATPLRDQSLAKAIGRTHFRYTQYINELHGRSGHLWQNRFQSCALDETHAVAALRYVERNPVRAHLVGRAWEYEWSSAAAHVGESGGRGLLDLEAWWARWRADDWREVLSEPQDEGETSVLRLSTSRGRPLGTDHFLSRLENLVGRRLRPLPVGRPRKPAEEQSNR